MSGPDPKTRQIVDLIERALDDLFAALDSSDLTPDDVEAADEPEIAEWFRTWIESSDPDPTEGMTRQEVARMVHDMKNL